MGQGLSFLLLHITVCTVKELFASSNAKKTPKSFIILLYTSQTKDSGMTINRPQNWAKVLLVAHWFNYYVYCLCIFYPNILCSLAPNLVSVPKFAIVRKFPFSFLVLIGLNTKIFCFILLLLPQLLWFYGYAACCHDKVIHELVQRPLNFGSV